MNRQCPVCGKTVADGAGILWSPYRMVVHEGECKKRLEEGEKDYSRSAHGRHRPTKKALLAAIRNEARK